MSWSRDAPTPGGCAVDGMHVALGFFAVFAMHALAAAAFAIGASFDPTETFLWMAGLWGMGLGCTQLTYVLPIGLAAGFVRRQWAIGIALGAIATIALQAVNYALCGVALTALIYALESNRHELPQIPPTLFDVEPDGELIITLDYLSVDSETSATGETLWSLQGPPIPEEALCGPGGPCPTLPPLFEISLLRDSLQIVALDGGDVLGSWYEESFYAFDPPEILGEPPQTDVCEGQSALDIRHSFGDWSEISGTITHRWPADCLVDGALPGGELEIQRSFKAFPRDPLPPPSEP